MNELKDNLAKLVFDFQLANIRNLGESQTRLSFIDKFWNYLGWDVSNLTQVQVEVTDRKHQRPDYRFMKGRNKVAFFVEAKKPTENLKNPKHIYQTMLYCWNGSVPMAILTDFEEFRPFRAIGKPKLEDWNKGLIKQFDITYEAYPDLAYELLNNFGREAVLAGSLDALVKPTKLELRDTVDKHFLNSLSIWRTELADKINKANNFANEFYLSEAIQRILDRLVFLRILQDRDIETIDYIRLISSFKVGDVYAEFVKICKQLAPKYNGLIFNPHPLSENLKVESTLFKKIVKELVYEDSPYRFDEMPVETLGTIYERFLGDEITFNKRGNVEIKQKPEVQKANGIFYTPQYIVEYIVQNTVGKLLKNCKTPEDVAKLKILDPSCGSGSFLLCAFDFLIKWHEDYFSANPGKALEKSGKQSYLLAYPDKAGQTKLTARMKGKILQNNIYGVDLDKQATEVAQMSLYIKVLEGMANESQMSLGFRDAILPKLDDNIKCGNSLIGSDFIQPDFFQLSEKERQKINPFDWVDNFPFIKETGGFDIVIGNPPYIKEYTYREIFENVKKSYLKHYYQGKMDFWYFFVCNGIDLLKQNGLLGYIAPNNWVTNAGASILRNKVLTDSKILQLIDFQDFMVFESASIQTMILILEKNKDDNYLFINNKVIGKKTTIDDVDDLLQKKHNNNLLFLNPKVEINKYLNSFLVFGEMKKEKLLDSIKLKQNYCLDERTEVAQGIVTPQDNLNKKNAEVLNNLIAPGTGIFILKEQEVKSLNLNNNEYEIIKPYYQTDELIRYYGNKKNKHFIIYTDSKFKNIAEIKKYPNIKNHLDKFKSIITSDFKPYGLHRARNKFFFQGEKIISLRKCENPTFTYTDFDCFVSQTFYIIKSEKINIKFLTGLLNSNLIKFWLKNKGKMQGNIYQIDKEPLLQIPIYNPRLEVLSEKTIQDKILELVERMLKLHKDLQSASDFDRKHIETFIKNTDKEIDELVYKLYGLTPEEIKIVEGN